MCPAAAPAPPASNFEACGGDPFGAWRLREYDLSEVKFVVNVQSINSLNTSCDVGGAMANDDVELALELTSGGSGRIHTSGIVVVGDILERCADDALNTSCAGLAQCTAGPCGTCQCENSLDDFTGGVSWERTDTTLTLDAGSPVEFEYCVEGSTLSLKMVGFPAVIYELQPLELVGTPAPCAEREPGKCAGAGCRIGLCVGGASCAASVAEASCTNVQGCTWDADACSGTAAATCNVEDYGHVTGCDF